MAKKVTKGTRSKRKAAGQQPPSRSPARRRKATSSAGAAQTRTEQDEPQSDVVFGDTGEFAAQQLDVPTVVGVGASAGGLEAFSQLLEALPQDSDLAIVFVQHLSPQHESALPSLLASKTALPIVQVTDGLKIEPRHVYVIPPNVQMEVKNGTLHLVPRPYDRSQFTPIDHFLLSLAGWAQNRAIGVILSGTASDGTSGIREIKAAGGITIAQAPSTAKYDGMPQSAIATGLVDLILSPHDIAEHLSHIHVHPYLGEAATQPGDGSEPTEEQLGEIFAILRRVSGIDFRQYKTPTIRRRLLRRMALQRVTGVDTYIRHVRENGKEASLLYQDLLIHVTRFFREPESFDVLRNQVFPEIVSARSEDEPIRIWVPGCATGEEAYSVAIALMEILDNHANSRRVQIFATDVSESAIEQARSGVYPLSIAADVSSERLKRFFTKADGAFRLNKTLRDACVFARHDLTKDPPFSRLDLIVCRNVMIYLDARLQRRLISVFHYALRTRGFLMLGAAETAGAQHLFALVDKRWRLYRKSAVDTALPVSFSVDRFPAMPPAPLLSRASRPEPVRSANDEANRFLLQRYSPPSVVVDDGLQIVQFRGQTGHFLEAASGEPNLSVLKMAREGLLFPLRGALQTARRKLRPVRREGISIHRNGEWHNVDVEVVPLGSSASSQMLIVFEEMPPAPGKKRRLGRARQTPRLGKRETEERLAGLTRELAASREYMQSIIQELEAANEELQSANEEILSSNEELQSTNEELDTAKEELQSTNEELNTLNEELHSRNDELSRVNSDLLNLLSTVEITILIVGNDMRIRRFTPTAERMLNLIPGDVGRPLGQINTNLAAANLEALAQETIETFLPRELEVQDRLGKWYMLRVRPYRNVDNRIDGAVLTLIDIGAAKLYQQQIERSREQLLQTVDLMQEPVIVIDETMHVKTANQAFYRAFGLEPSRTVGKAIVDLDHREWQGKRLQAFALQLQGGTAAIQGATIGGPASAPNLLASGRQFQLEDGKYWTVLALTPSNGNR